MSVFLLVEDSPAMQRLWPAVRDRGLQPLLESLQGRTPIPVRHDDLLALANYF